MIFSSGPMDGLVIIQPSVFGDERGYFYESYNIEEFKKNGIDINFVQDNQSMSHKGALRGLHFQFPPFAQGKLVRVIRGAVLDVVVDIRKSSPTYGKYFGIELTEKNFTMFWVPPGFAHGFATLEDNTLFSYKCTNVYHKECEGGLLWNDQSLNIDWRIHNPILSDKDRFHTTLNDFVSPF